MEMIHRQLYIIVVRFEELYTALLVIVPENVVVLILEGLCPHLLVDHRQQIEGVALKLPQTVQSP